MCSITGYICYFSNGTGVIGRLKIKGSLQYVLLTCHHVIPTEKDATSANFYFGYTDDAKDPLPCPAANILDTSGQWFWTDPSYHNSVSRWGSLQPPEYLSLDVCVVS